MAKTKPSNYPYTETEPPGVNVNHLREARGWTIYDLAAACDPPLDASTVARIEHNVGYTSHSLRKVAKALRVNVADLFHPREIAAYASLPPDVRQRLADTIQDVAAAYDARKRAR